MNMSRKMIRNLIIIFIVIIAVLIAALVIIMKKGDNGSTPIIKDTEDWLGATQEPEEGTNGYSANTQGIPENIASKIPDLNVLMEQINQFLYKNGLVDTTGVQYISHTESGAVLKIKFELVGCTSKQYLEAIIDTQKGTYAFATEMERSEYFAVVSCLRNYLDMANKTNPMYTVVNRTNGQSTYDQNMNEAAVYSLLSSRYIAQNNITTDNVFNTLKPFNEKQSFYPLDITKEMEVNFVTSYKIQGIVQNATYAEKTQVYFVINLDSTNNTFSVEPLAERTYNQYSVAMENVTAIETNEYNGYIEETIDERTIANEYLDMYKFFAFANPKYIYDKMPETYRVQRFGTLENYAKYIQSSKEELMGARVERYTVNKEGQYIITDQYQNEYVFKSNNIFDFSVTLDVEGISNTNNF